MPDMDDVKECSCDQCQAACAHFPGRFLPGEAEKAAEHLGMSLDEFFHKHLGVNWWVGGTGDSGEDAFILAPAITSMTPGSEYPGNPRGRCVFFKEGRCEIHAVKPFECRAMIHGQPKDVRDARNLAIATAWDTPEHQKQIEDLLGRKPVAEEVGWLELLRW